MTNFLQKIWLAKHEYCYITKYQNNVGVSPPRFEIPLRRYSNQFSKTKYSYRYLHTYNVSYFNTSILEYGNIAKKLKNKMFSKHITHLDNHLNEYSKELPTNYQ